MEVLNGEGEREQFEEMVKEKLESIIKNPEAKNAPDRTDLNVIRDVEDVLYEILI